jgi:hypothetical protein
MLERRDLLSANVLSYHNDWASTGANLNETVLAPSNVSAASFGKTASTPVDGQVYAQPLYLENVNISTGAGQGVHNVVFVATEHDSVYAIDSTTGGMLWHTSFINPGAGVTSVPAVDSGSTSLTPELGVTATPVIDPATGTIYVSATTKEIRADGAHYLYRLHALDVSTGAEKFGGPAVIGDTLVNGSSTTYVSGPTVTGSGDDSVNGLVTFDALQELGRCGLTLAGGDVFLAFGTHADSTPGHGWVISVNAQNLQITGAINLTPNGSLGDIWEAGDAVTTDGNGAFYVVTGNGTFDATLDAAGLPSNADYGDSVVKFVIDPASSPTNRNANGWGLKIVDYFSPSNTQQLQALDLDLASGGVVLLPASAGTAAHPNLLIQGGKQGTLYLMDRDNMPGFDPTTDRVVQESSGQIGPEFSAPAYFNGSLYYAAVGDFAKAFPISNGHLATSPSSQSGQTFGYPGSTPSISANGAANGIVWLIDNGTNQLRAYDAANLARQLYNSDQNGARDQLGSAVKFSTPTVADGHVFVGTANSVVIYGLRSGGSGSGGGAPGAPVLSPVQNYVAAAYQDILGRPADGGALASWGALLSQGYARGTFTQQLAHSDESYHRVIEAAYEHYLGRASDPAGLAAWTFLMRTGLSDEHLEANFIASPEYYRHSGGTNRGWVDGMYQDLLGRAADPSGEATWVQALAFGVTRDQIAYDFAASPEREAIRIRADYSQYLGRGVSAQEVANWVFAFEHGFSNEDVIAGFAASDEYFRNHASG